MIHQFQYIISLTIKMSFMDNYLSVSPAAPQPIAFKRQNQRSMMQYQYFNNQYKKRSASLAEMYSAKIKEQSKDDLAPTAKKKQLPLYSLSPKGSHLLENINKHRVSRTIDSVHQYSQHLKSTLINQYKAQKIQSFRSKKHRLEDQPHASPTQVQALNSVIESQKNDDRMMKTLKQSHPKGDFKTLQMLYQAIIDTSFHSRKKEAWELQAVKLPIVDRFKDRTEMLKFERQLHAKNKPQALKNAQALLPLSKTEHSKEMKNEIRHAPHELKQESMLMHTITARHNRLRKDKEDDSVDIIPWKTNQENTFD